MCGDEQGCDGFVEADLHDGFVNVYTTGRNGPRLNESTVLKLPIIDENNKLKFKSNEIDLGGNKRQTVLGFGGALTDAALLAFDSLSESTQRQLEEMWFGFWVAKQALDRQNGVRVGQSYSSTGTHGKARYLETAG